MINETAFLSPSNLLQWALEDIENISRAWALYLKEMPYEIYSKIDDHTGHQMIYVRVNREMPKGIEKEVHNACNAVKHAFDQILWGMLTTIYPGYSENTNFPWGDTRNNTIQNMRKKNIEDSEIQKLILETQPYFYDELSGDGDELLRCFSHAVNPNKHRISISARPNHALTEAKINFYGNIEVEAEIIMVLDSHVSYVGDHIVLKIIKVQNVKDFDINLSFELTFGDESKIARRPVIDTLEYALNRANNLLERSRALIGRRFDGN